MVEAVRSIAMFADYVAKTRYLDGAAREDAMHPAILALGARFRPLPPAARAEALFAFVRWRVAYQDDVNGEEFDSSVITIYRGADDCDGSARALVALALAAGLEARIRGVVSGDGAELEHVQAELRWLGSLANPHADPEGWVLAETTLAGVHLGQGAEAGTTDREGNYALVRGGGSLAPAGMLGRG